MNNELLQRARGIRLAIFDVDGVLTDGRLYFLADGSEFKTFNTLDGHGIKMLINSGVRTAIISGRTTRSSSAAPGIWASSTSTRDARTSWPYWTNYWPNWDSTTSRSPTSATTCPTCRLSVASAWAWRWPAPTASFAGMPMASPWHAAAKARPANSAN